jgi:2-polyprenyl-3-methyl-5-hydroxy-6-metoxy-1,4-benzoquinol methylase
MSILDRLGYEAIGLGERFNIDCLRYNPITFKMYDRLAVRDAPTVVAALRSHFPKAQTVIDVGAGTGAFAAEAQRQGYNVTAIERSRHGRRIAKEHGVRALPFDLKSNPPARVSGRYDLAYCFEVAEHVPATLADRLVAFLCQLAPSVVLTAATPGQGGTGHINEQPANYWTQRFAGHQYLPVRFSLHPDGLSPHWGKTNLLAFQRLSQ